MIAFGPLVAHFYSSVYTLGAYCVHRIRLNEAGGYLHISRGEAHRVMRLGEVFLAGSRIKYSTTVHGPRSVLMGSL